VADIEVEQLDAVRRITLNRPEVLNPISWPMAEALVGEIESAADDPDTRVVLLRGTGRAFCAGYDASGGTGTRPTVGADAAKLRRMTLTWARIWNSPVPVIAQVHGYCLAGGTDLASHCDLVLVADDARIGYPAVRSMGSPPSNMWLYHVGAQWAKRLLLTGDTITGRLAAQIGFALQSVPAEKLEDTALALARRVSMTGSELLGANKAVINHGLDLMGRASLQYVSSMADAIGHQAPETLEFWSVATEEGLKAALKRRDDPFRELEPLDIEELGR
jgi:enoyl-CoA hydratase